MNRKNIEALSEIIRVWENDGIDTKHGVYPSLSEWLASRGVLAVEALTDEDAEWFDTTDRVGGDGRARVVRQKLEKIAKGEDPSDYTPFQP